MINVSVIIPVYNTKKFLKKCLNSIINQTLKNIEIIIINDGSTDNSYKIIQKYADIDHRIKIINLKTSCGVSKARNLGINIANGEYIGFLDSDDSIDLDFFEKLFTAAKKYNSDIAVAGIKRLRPFKWKYHLKFINEEFTTDIGEKFHICDVPYKCYVWNKIYKLSKIKNYNLYFEPDIYFEDRLFTAKSLYFLNSLVTVYDTFYNYWTNPASIVKTVSKKKLIDEKYTRKKMFDFMVLHNLDVSNFEISVEHFKLFGIKIIKKTDFINKTIYKLFNIFSFAIKKNCT